MSIYDTTYVSLVEDDDDFRDGWKFILNNIDGIKCSKTYSSVEQIIGDYQKNNGPWTNVILMDINFGEGCMNGIQGVKVLKPLLPPDTKFIMLTNHDNPEFLTESLKNGAHGYLQKDILNLPEVEAAIKGVMKGEARINLGVAQELERYFNQYQNFVRSEKRLPKNNSKEELEQALLTDQQIEILSLFKKGNNEMQIAENLGVSRSTVKNRVSEIIGKLHVGTKLQALLKAQELGYI